MYNYIDIFLIFIDFNNNQYDNPVRYDSQILISINKLTNAFTSILFPLRMETKENKFCRCQLFLRKIMTDSVLLINLSQYDVRMEMYL